MSPPRIAPPPSNSDTSEDDAPLDERLDVRNATRKANNAGLEQVVPWSFVRRMSRRSKDLATSAARALASPRANTPTVRPVPRPGAAVTCLEDFACLEDQDLEPHRPHRSAAAPEQRPPSALAPAVSRTSTPPTTDDMVLPIPPERPTVVEEAFAPAPAPAATGGPSSEGGGARRRVSWESLTGKTYLGRGEFCSVYGAQLDGAGTPALMKVARFVDHHPAPAPPPHPRSRGLQAAA